MMSSPADSIEERLDILKRNKPCAGMVLLTKDGCRAPVHVDYKPDLGAGETRIMYVNCLIDDDFTGWYLTAKDTGLKALILPRSQVTLIERNDDREFGLWVTALRVVRQNEKKTALFCELEN